MWEISLLSKIDAWDSRDSNTTFILGDCLFRGVKLANNSDSNKYGNKGSWNKMTVNDVKKNIE